MGLNGSEGAATVPGTDRSTDLRTYQTDPARKQSHRKSLRTRPSQILRDHHAEPLSPIRDSARTPPMQHRNSTMSLFNLFSKPKVERARGYAEQGLGTTQTPVAPEPRSQREHLTVRAATDNGPREIPSRSPSAMSWAAAMRRGRTKPALDHEAPRERKAGQWTPPPLFQAYPQSTKHGVLEAYPMPAEMVLQKAKGRRGGPQPTSSPEHSPRESVETTGAEVTRIAKTSTRHVVNGNIPRMDLPRKIFVLVTSGYLLQYSDVGPSDRLPERVLQLGKDSAAFACDLLPGKHFVLQISQSIDQQGAIIANSGSIFSRFGIRNAASRRMTTSLLLVMPDAAEMDAWMVATREQIQVLGGQKTAPQTSTRSPATGGFKALEKSLSQSNRYKVLRQPGKSPVNESFEEAKDSLPPLPKESDRSETNTIDGIEQDADQLVEELNNSPERPQCDADAQSVRSSVALSTEPRNVSSLRSSNRASHSTFTTTVASSSRTNSFSSSSTRDCSSDTSRDSFQSKSSYRTLASYSTNSRRRSAMPTQPMSASDITAHVTRYPLKTGLPMVAPRKLASEPNLRVRHDSKLQTSPVLFEDAERPQSIVGDLPTPVGGRTPKAEQARSATRGPRQHSVQPFSIPLKVNPSGPAVPQAQQKRVQSEGEPQTHTLTAKVTAGAPPSHLPQQQNNPNRARLSLFPHQIPTPSPPLTDPLALSAAARSPVASHVSRPPRRPTSLQVRTDPAPFSTAIRGPPPIRSLKPSRSSIACAAPSHPASESKSVARNENYDGFTPLIGRTSSPSGMKTAKSRASLPELDLGIPVVGLGPPVAPPPSVPLPLPPAVGLGLGLTA